MEINYDGPLPPSQQIADWLRGRIRSGEFGPDQRIPTQTDIVQETGVATTTARRAIAILREEGWIYTVHARGSFRCRELPE